MAIEQTLLESVKLSGLLPMPGCLPELVSALRCGDLDLGQYVEVVCDRMDALEPYVQALVAEPHRRARLRPAASALHDAYEEPARRPPLYGVLVGVKDVLAVDGLPTVAGSSFPAEHFANTQATCVTRLQRAGALILGKTHTDEFGYCEPGPTRNPHHLEHTAGGSSAGSAAAVAAGYCPLALGTHSSRSIICPASFCGVVGFKPSFGRIPADGMVYLAPSLDTVGLFTTTAHSMLTAASILCDDWPRLRDVGLPVLGVPEGGYFSYLTPEARTLYDHAVKGLERAGVSVVRVPFLDEATMDKVYEMAMDLMHGEMAIVHDPTWFHDNRHLYRPRTAAGIAAGQKVAPTQLAAYRTGQKYFRVEVEKRMTEAGVNAWIVPSTPGPAPAGLEFSGSASMTTPWSYAGLPCISLPLVQAPGRLPYGVQLVGRFWEDDRLLQWAVAVEQIWRERVDRARSILRVPPRA